MSDDRRRTSRGLWLRTALVVILAVVGMGVGGVALFGRTGAPDRDAKTAELVETQKIPSLNDDTSPAALFLGDSYTMGPYALADLGYACLTAANMGWECNLDNQPGTGYIAGGENQRLPKVVGAIEVDSTSINERFAHVREMYRADIVVLDGGRNDLRFGPLYLRNMMELTIYRAIEAWPNARIVVILPWLVMNPAVLIPDTDIPVNTYLTTEMRSIPAFDAVTIIDPAALGWFKDGEADEYVSDDLVHPNFAGNRKVAEYLTRALQQDGFAVSK